ncbi:4154_t:CDS:2 [Diversispora eburnea]|uniref:4154_t:CDS:1 n=1 Tax=Diversispora eburnea TaxID=1213867 RepID=A0A9N8YMA8_9GLOM|nr:4154_t:CDS:2 [Diversispora eburnea]
MVENDDKDCVLLDNFAIFVQILLASIAFSTLIYKRHRERPQRPLPMPFLFNVGKWLMGWTLHDKKLQVVFVMLIFPLIMNIVQFWLVDQVIKKKLEKVKLEGTDSSREDEMFLRVDISDDELSYNESLSSYHPKGSNVSLSSTYNSAPLLKGTFSNNENNFNYNGSREEVYIELHPYDYVSRLRSREICIVIKNGSKEIKTTFWEDLFEEPEA